MRIGKWLFADGDLFRVHSINGSDCLVNWSRPRIDYMRGLWHRIIRMLHETS